MKMATRQRGSQAPDAHHFLYKTVRNQALHGWCVCVCVGKGGRARSKQTPCTLLHQNDTAGKQEARRRCSRHPGSPQRGPPHLPLSR
jgi:hypothetical protein